MQLPKLIYETYPVLYIIAGVLTMLLQQSWIASACGLLLSLSGTAILLLRRNYRAIRQHLEPRDSLIRL